MEPKEKKDTQKQILEELKRVSVFMEMLATVCTGIMRKVAPEEYKMYLDAVYCKDKEAMQ